MTTRPTQKQPAAEWVYRGIWRVLADWFNVPESPPDLPTQPHDPPNAVQSFHPARGFLKLLKLEFWIVLLLIDVAILVGWIVLTIFQPILGIILLIPALIIAIVPDVIAYIAIHLRYDTTWYVMSPRSLRVRRGIWVINEQTITFENVQDVKVTKGPLQQLFGIANVSVSTAGAGKSDQHGHTSGNTAILEGIDNPNELRTLIMDRVRASRSAGLGDDDDARAAAHTRHAPTFTPAHTDLLRQIRDELKAIPS